MATLVRIDLLNILIILVLYGLSKSAEYWMELTLPLAYYIILGLGLGFILPPLTIKRIRIDKDDSSTQDT